LYRRRVLAAGGVIESDIGTKSIFTYLIAGSPEEWNDNGYWYDTEIWSDTEY
jgi:hypothetical protein